MNYAVKKILICAFVALAVGGGWFQIDATRRQLAEIAELTKRTGEQRRQVQRLRAEIASRQAHAPETPAPPPPAFATGDPAFNARMNTILARMNQLRQWLEKNPKQKIPELAFFLQDSDWIGAVSSESNLDLSRAAHLLRAQAQGNLVLFLQGGLKSYEAANQGQLPDDLAELSPFFVVAIPDSILGRYEMRASGNLEKLPQDLPILSERAEAIGDSSESAFMIFANGWYGNESFHRIPFLALPAKSPELAEAISKANQAFRIAHQGVSPADATQLAPFFKNPSDAAVFEKLSRRIKN